MKASAREQVGVVSHSLWSPQGAMQILLSNQHCSSPQRSTLSLLGVGEEKTFLDPLEVPT